MDVLPEVPMEPVFPMESPSTSALRLEEEISLSLRWTCTFGRHNLVVFPTIVILAVLLPVQWTLFDFWFTRSRWNEQATIGAALLTKVAWIAQLNFEHVLKFLRPDNFMQLSSRGLFWKFVATFSSRFRLRGIFIANAPRANDRWIKIRRWSDWQTLIFADVYFFAESFSETETQT